MARTNFVPLPGFRPLNATESDYIIVPVASAYGTALYPGEPVIAVNDGTVAQTPAGSAAGAATDGITGVITQIIQYKDPAGFVRRNAPYLPASTSWTNHHERSLVQICLATSGQRFRVRGDTGQASLAAARSIQWLNVDHEYGTADTGLGLTGVQLNMSTAADTATLQWRIIEAILDMPSNDPTQANVELVVMANLVAHLPVLGASTTGL